MASDVTLDVFGHQIPVSHMTPMARGIVAHTNGDAGVRWAGFAWHQPLAERSEHLEEAATELEAA